MAAKKELPLKEQIDAALEAAQDTGHRWHLGASIIGRDCAREIWYMHRWCKKQMHEGRILRLFDRGHREEPAIVAFLRLAKIEVQDVDANGDQFRVLTHSGHFGGSMDAKLSKVPLKILAGLRVLGEFKTHNEKSFANVAALGCRKAKPEHYSQQQVYMEKEGLHFSIYIAVNKNDDDLHIEVVAFDPVEAERINARATSILTTDQPPLRIDNNPAFWKCKMCNFRLVCHGTEKPEINCRTCAHVMIVMDDDGGKWKCVKHGYEFTKELEDRDAEALPAEVVPRMHDGCPDHVYNPYMLNGVEFLGGNEAENYATLRLPDGRIVHNGPNHTTSQQLCLSLPVTTKKKP